MSFSKERPVSIFRAKDESSDQYRYGKRQRRKFVRGYLSASPELMREAMRRLEQRWENQP